MSVWENINKNEFVKSCYIVHIAYFICDFFVKYIVINMIDI